MNDKDYALTPEEIVNNIDLDKERMYFDGKGSCVSTFDLTNLLKVQVSKVLLDIHGDLMSLTCKDNYETMSKRAEQLLKKVTDKMIGAAPHREGEG